MLDNFNRANGGIGLSWSGSKSGYAIASNRLDVGSGGYLIRNPSKFGANQEAYVTLTTIDTAATEIDLVLKAQSTTSYLSGAMRVVYKPTTQVVQVWTYTLLSGWVQRGTNLSVTYVNGDRFGARTFSNGQVEIYRNGTLVGTRNASFWSFASSTGYVGLWMTSASNAILDDFGGGTTP